MYILKIFTYVIFFIIFFYSDLKAQNLEVDISKNWEQFITMKNNIIKSKELVEYAFTCYNKDIPVNISNLCVYEQAYLDYLIEKQLGYKLENWQRYPTNTKDLKPKQAWEGKRYDL